MKYGVATISRLLKIIGLFCRILSLLQGSFAKETYDFNQEENEEEIEIPHNEIPHNRTNERKKSNETKQAGGADVQQTWRDKRGVSFVSTKIKKLIIHKNKETNHSQK